MTRTTAPPIIDARPRGPTGRPLAEAVVLGRPVLAHLVELAGDLHPGPVTVHARLDEHPRLRALLARSEGADFALAPGPPPEGSVILRADRLYDPRRLRRALRRGRDPETAVLWRLDSPRGLAGADDELLRRHTYQPIGRLWALNPARRLARWLAPTAIRPNTLTLLSAALVLTAAGLVAFGPAEALPVRLGAALALALGLVLDTADGHLARLQGTASNFGRWLDANLDELGDMALHAAIAWSLFAHDGRPVWLLLGMLYGMGKYVFFVGNQTWLDGGRPAPAGVEVRTLALASPVRRLAHWAGHADVRWHLWIVLAALGRLDLELIAFAGYYPVRALFGAFRKRKAGGRG